MRDHAGVEWLPINEAAQRVTVNPKTVRSWVDRGKVEAHTILRRVYVRVPDVARAEQDTRERYRQQRERPRVQ